MTRLFFTDSFSMAAWPEMNDFLAENYRPDYSLRDRALFEWQFGDSSDHARANLVCAHDGDHLVGILGYTPLDLFWGDTRSPIRGAWMANWMVEADYRTGTGAIMMRRLMELFPVLLGQGANDLNRPIAKLLGFRIYSQIPRYVAVFDPDRTTAFLISRDGGIPSIWSESSGTSDVAHHIPEGYDPDWSLYPSLRFGTVRSAGYLRWRYLDHPIFDYSVLVLGDGTQPAVCVFRVEQTSGDVNDIVGRIVEFYFPRSDDGERCGTILLSTALAELRRRGCAFADFYCTTRSISNALHRAGMTTGTALLLATRMNPVELKLRQQNLEIWARQGLITPPDLPDLYVTKADGDQDRPN